MRSDCTYLHHIAREAVEEHGCSLVQEWAWVEGGQSAAAVIGEAIRPGAEEVVVVVVAAMFQAVEDGRREVD
jgi:hypothetical protein